MARRLKQTKAAKAARRRYRAARRAGKIPKRGCGKRKWAKGGNAHWKCKPGAKRHAYAKKKKAVVVMKKRKAGGVQGTFRV